MGKGLLGIDHLIVGVRDLEAARAQYARLGFNSTPRGRHVGWGTANYCIMFEEDYLELLGIVDPAQFTNRLDLFLESREGLLGVALATDDPQATHDAWAQAGLEPAEPQALGRLLELEGVTVELRFRNVMLDSARSGGVSLFACEHLTPELLRQPAWLMHPNGAVGLASCTIVTPDPAPVVEAMTRLFGRSAITDTDNVVAVHSGRGVLLIAPPEDAELMHPLLEVPAGLAEPQLMVLTVKVADPTRAASFLKLQGVPFERGPLGEIWVPAEAAHGVTLELTRA